MEEVRDNDFDKHIMSDYRRFQNCSCNIPFVLILLSVSEV